MCNNTGNMSKSTRFISPEFLFSTRDILLHDLVHTRTLIQKVCFVFSLVISFRSFVTGITMCERYQKWTRLRISRLLVALIKCLRYLKAHRVINECHSFLDVSLETLTLFFACKLQEEEEERSDRWNSFLEDHAESVVSSMNGSSENNHVHPTESDKIKEEGLNNSAQGKDLHSDKLGSDLTPGNVREEDEQLNAENNVRRFQIWTEIRPSLRPIEDLMSVHVRKKEDSSNGEQEAQKLKSSPSNDEAKSSNGVYENDSEDEFYDVERSDPVQNGFSDGTSVSSMSAAADADAASLVSSCPWKEELEVLVRAGAPMALRGEVINLAMLHYCLLLSI